ncbi:MAG TPA: PAS domain S-box protein [Variovorax sp.]|nr:PAS domain S-box protein [Variovorax sp.]
MNPALTPRPVPAEFDDAPAPTVHKGLVLQSSEELRALNNSFASLVMHPSGRIIRANNRFLRECGYEPEDIAGIDIAVLSPTADGLAESAARDWRCVLDGRASGVERLRLHKDGTLHWIEAFYTLLKDGEGRIAQVVELSRDITERVLRTADEQGQVRAINASQAVVEFALDGTVLDANAIFLDAMGYRLEDVVGQHHRRFVAPDEADSASYAGFWSRLAAGHHHAGEYRRIAKDGREVWLQATYNPIRDPLGRPLKVVKYAADVTRERLMLAEFQWQVMALRKSHCVITFDMHGVVLDANDHFLQALGYRLEEIVGRHHRIFVDPAHTHGAEYAAFWHALEAGHHQSGQYLRIGRDGREVWLQANYSPVFDMAGRLIKVVKYATVITEEKRRQAEHQGQIAAIHKAQSVVAFHLDGSVIDANENFLDLMGYRLSDVRGRHHRMFVEPELGASAGYAAFWQALGRGTYQSGEFKRIGKDGREVWLQATYNPIMDVTGRPTKVIKYATDITREKLRRADFQSQITAIDKSQGTMTLSLEGVILNANANLLATLGYRLEDIVGRDHAILLEPEVAGTPAYEAFWDTLRSGQFVSGRYKRIGRDGREIWLQASYNPIFDLDGELDRVMKFAIDITADVAMAEAFEDARRQAHHDAATSLPNRIRLASFLSTHLTDERSRLAVMYLDLDRFKAINDTHGHHVGDKVLGAVADRLRRSLRADQIAARIGGDEFVIAAPHLNEEEITRYCQHVLELLAAPIVHDGGELFIGASIGIAMAPNDGTSPDELLRAADTALYRSKRNGRGTYCFFSTRMNDRLQASRRLTDDMRRGIAAGEFYLEFQPRFDAHTQTIRSAEALVRWHHPEHGRMAPDLFIPLAERSGLILPLGDWVLLTACQTARDWPGIGVSVNVSPVQFRDGRLVERVRHALEASGLAPGRLEIELTEGVLLEDAKRAGATMRELKEVGVRLAVDDFGTGYASLSYLRSFPFDVIKIDRQFIGDLEPITGGRAIVQAILALGKALGLTVTAEGVETDRQLEMLVEDHCSEVQGFLLARPMAAAQLGALYWNDDDDARPTGPRKTPRDATLRLIG